MDIIEEILRIVTMGNSYKTRTVILVLGHPLLTFICTGIACVTKLVVINRCLAQFGLQFNSSVHIYQKPVAEHLYKSRKALFIDILIFTKVVLSNCVSRVLPPWCCKSVVEVEQRRRNICPVLINVSQVAVQNCYEN